MRSNSKEVREKIKAHILECVYDENDMNYSDFAKAKKRVLNEFVRVANHPYNMKRLPDNQERFSDYLNAIPWDFYFYTRDIKNFLNSLGINPSNKEFDSEKSLKLYHNLIWREIK